MPSNLVWSWPLHSNSSIFYIFMCKDGLNHKRGYAIIGFIHGLPCHVKNMALGPQSRQKPRPTASVFIYMSPSCHVFNIAWQAMIKTYNTSCPETTRCVAFGYTSYVLKRPGVLHSVTRHMSWNDPVCCTRLHVMSWNDPVCCTRLHDMSWNDSVCCIRLHAICPETTRCVAFGYTSFVLKRTGVLHSNMHYMPWKRGSHWYCLSFLLWIKTGTCELVLLKISTVIYSPIYGLNAHKRYKVLSLLAFLWEVMIILGVIINDAITMMITTTTMKNIARHSAYHCSMT